MDEEYMSGFSDALVSSLNKLNSRARIRISTECCFHSALGALQNFSMEAQ